MLWQHIVLCNSTLLGMCLAYGVCPVLLSAACCHSINSVLWQHIVLCKSTLLGMCLAMVCVVCYVVRERTLTQHDKLPQHPVNIMELFYECF